MSFAQNLDLSFDLNIYKKEYLNWWSFFTDKRSFLSTRVKLQGCMGTPILINSKWNSKTSNGGSKALSISFFSQFD